MPEIIQSVFIRRKEVTKDLVIFYFKVTSEIQFSPGQYANIFIDEKIYRPYSIVDIEQGIISFLINTSRPGKGVNYLKSLNANDKVYMEIPLGRFGLVENIHDKKYLFVSTGAGIAPFVSMIKEVNDKDNVYLIHGSRTKKSDIVNIYYHVVLRNFISDYTPCYSRENYSDQAFWSGRVTSYLESQDNLVDFEIYVCGSHELISDTRKLLRKKGIKKFHYEDYG